MTRAAKLYSNKLISQIIVKWEHVTHGEKICSIFKNDCRKAKDQTFEASLCGNHS